MSRHKPSSGAHGLAGGVAANLTYGHKVVQQQNDFVLSTPKHMHMRRSMIRGVGGDDESALPQDFTDLSYHTQPPGFMQMDLRRIRLPDAPAVNVDRLFALAMVSGSNRIEAAFQTLGKEIRIEVRPAASRVTRSSAPRG